MGNPFSYLSKKMSGDEEEFDFPKTLEEFGYHFNEEGQLRNIETNNGFNFVEKEDNHRYNQKRYEAMGDIITEYIYNLLEKEGLERIKIPIDAKENEPTSFFFQTNDAQSNPDKLLILIHGSGPVKAGQWARRLIMNDCLDSGTQLPYIRWAMKNGYAVIVANTNVNSIKVGTGKKKIRENESPEKHTDYLWNHFVRPAKAKNIAIVAHSYGGVSVLNLVNLYLKEFKERVFAMAFTDSVHSFQHQDTSEETIAYFVERGVNWASAYDPLDTKLKTHIDYTPTVSAGTDKHELTSYSSMESIFKFITKKYAEKTNTPIPEGCDWEPKELKLDPPGQSEDLPMSQDVSDSKSNKGQVTQNKDLPMSQDTENESSGSENTQPMSQDMSGNSQGDIPMSQEERTNTEGSTNDKIKSEL